MGAELAMKADLIRSGKDSGRHKLPSLYQRLDCKHREEIERRFAEAPLMPICLPWGVSVPRCRACWAYTSTDSDGVRCTWTRGTWPSPRRR